MKYIDWGPASFTDLASYGISKQDKFPALGSDKSKLVSCQTESNLVPALLPDMSFIPAP